MPNAAASRSELRGWLLPTLLIGLAVTAFRILLLAFDRTDLFVDEAQYWLWGQEMALGYYSKPPLIGWVIRASTEIGGSDASFWVRLPAALLHFATSVMLAAIAAPRFGRAAAIWVGTVYITLPMVVVGSLMISTDTIMVPFLVAAFWAWTRGLDRGGSIPLGVLAGALLGMAFMAKYAAIYYVLCAALAAVFMWHARPGWTPALAGLAAFAVVISPNIVWNLQNGLSTLEHTLDNADWVRNPGDRANLNIAGFAAFLGSQFAVFGPILFAALLWLAATLRRLEPARRYLLAFSLPILAIVCLQALLSQAYANWAAAAYVTGTLAVVPWLLERGPRWLWASLVFNLTLAIALPLLTVFGTTLRLPDGRLALERYLGRSQMSAAILAAAQDNGLDVIVANDRDVLADLFYHGLAPGQQLFAQPVQGRPPHHYALKYPLPTDVAGPVLLVTKYRAAPSNCDAPEIGAIAPADGAYADRPQQLFVVPADCLRASG